MEEEQLQTLGAQLCHAIFCLHRMGFLHRDISCSNVLLVASSRCSHVNAKLIDFGLSCSGLSSSSRCGSIAYMSPEVLEKCSYGPDADWWSLGIVFYALIVGKTPLAIHAKENEFNVSKLKRSSR